jgi:methionyl-tRNA formyltransferase
VRFAFAGTPRFASLVLRDLVELGRVPALVISQPDRPKGRGRAGGTPHAIEQAICHGVDCMQTEDINSVEVAERLATLRVDTLVVAAFGQLLKKSILESVDCVNIHASLLPRYRGAAPIERAIMAGESMTGVTIMRVTEPLDEGPWAEKVQVSIGLRDDAGSLSRVLASAGAAALADVLTGMEDDTVRWTEQSGEASYAQKIGPDDWHLCAERGARRVHDQIRALSPAVGVRAKLGEVEVKIWRSWPYGQEGLDDVPEMARGVSGRSGQILAAAGRLFVGCQAGVVEVLELQPACRARMGAAAFLRGYPVGPGAKVGMFGGREGVDESRK